jgi:hypothetical protein
LRLADVPARRSNRVVSLKDTLQPGGTRFYRIVTPTQL